MFCLSAKPLRSWVIQRPTEVFDNKEEKRNFWFYWNMYVEALSLEFDVNFKSTFFMKLL